MDLGDGVRGAFCDTILREMNHEPRPRGSSQNSNLFGRKMMLFWEKLLNPGCYKHIISLNLPKQMRFWEKNNNWEKGM